MPNPQVKAFVHEITTPRVVFRIGAAADIVPESERLDGRRVLLIGAGHQHDLADRIAKSLGDRLAGRITEVAAHVPVPVARAAIDAARDLGAAQLLLEEAAAIRLHTHRQVILQPELVVRESSGQHSP